MNNSPYGNEDFFILSNGDDMYLIKNDSCVEFTNPKLTSVRTTHQMNQRMVYGEFNQPREMRPSNSYIDIDISLVSEQVRELSEFDIEDLFTLEKEVDVYKDYSIFELFELINKKLKERK